MHPHVRSHVSRCSCTMCPRMKKPLLNGAVFRGAGLGQGDRAQPLNSNPLTNLLQNQQLSQFRTSAAQHAPNAFSAAGYNFSQASLETAPPARPPSSVQTGA